MQPVSPTCSLLYKGSMHACTPTIDQATTVLCCVHNHHHHHHHHHTMNDDMMIMLHIESNSKLPNKSKVSTFRLCIWSKEEETICIWAPFPPSSSSSSSSYLYFRFVCSGLVSVVSLLFLNSLCLYSLVLWLGLWSFCLFFSFVWVLNFVKDFFCFKQNLFECYGFRQF